VRGSSANARPGVWHRTCPIDGAHVGALSAKQLRTSRDARDVAMRRCALVALLLLAAETGSDETGLSKGPENPADLGSRCAVLAGREDRAYLDCAAQAPKASSNDAASQERSPTEPSVSGKEGGGRRYPIRGR
jgi:hypothetical protein